MNATDLLALILVNSGHVANLLQIYASARAEGREELKPEEIARIRSGTLASEYRLAAAAGIPING